MVAAMSETAIQRTWRLMAENIAKERAAEASRKPERPSPPADQNAPLTTSEARTLNRQLHDETENLADKFLTAKRREIWKALGYSSWTDYCEKEWTESRSRIRQLVNFAETKEMLKDGTNVPSPECEGQTRPLGGLPAKQQKKAWKKAVKKADGGQPTAAQVKAAVEECKPAKAREVSSETNLPMHVEETRKTEEREMVEMVFVIAAQPDDIEWFKSLTKERRGEIITEARHRQ